MADIDNSVSTEAEVEAPVTEDTGAANAEIERLKAEIARQKAAVDKATKEAADAKRSLRARQTEEEAAAEEKRAQDEERDRKLAEYEKRFAIADTAKKVMKFVDDANVSDDIANYLYGAADIEKAVTALNKAWEAKEKKLRLEYGKIPAPGVGSVVDSTLTREQLDKMDYKDRLAFKQSNPTEYAHLMGRG